MEKVPAICPVCKKKPIPKGNWRRKTCGDKACVRAKQAINLKEIR